MKSKILLLAILIAIVSFIPSCSILDEPDFSTEVIQIEKSILSYYDTDGNCWYCREALIYANSKSNKVMFPIKYEGEIVSGTRIEWHCHKVLAYYVNGKKIPIDWDGTRQEN